MPRLNKTMLIGRPGKDPDMTYLENNKVARLSIATDESYTDKNTGQKVDATEWHQVEFFGRLAETVEQYVRKGALIYIEGRNKSYEYEKDGIKRYGHKIIASDLQFLERREDNRPGYDKQEQAGTSKPQPAPQQPVNQPQPTNIGYQQQPSYGYYYSDGKPFSPHHNQQATQLRVPSWTPGMQPHPQAMQIQGVY